MEPFMIPSLFFNKIRYMIAKGRVIILFSINDLFVLIYHNVFPECVFSEGISVVVLFVCLFVFLKHPLQRRVQSWKCGGNFFKICAVVQ